MVFRLVARQDIKRDGVNPCNFCYVSSTEFHFLSAALRLSLVIASVPFFGKALSVLGYINGLISYEICLDRFLIIRNVSECVVTHGITSCKIVFLKILYDT